MNFYALVPFAVVSVIQIVSCFFKKNKVKDISKIFLMPLLAFAAIYSMLPEFNLFLTAALVFGCLGDYFLIKPVSKKKFVTGLVSFFLGHVFYLLILIPRSRYWDLPQWFVLVLMLLSVTVVIGICRFVKLKDDLRGLGCVIYALVLMTVNFTTVCPIIPFLIQFGPTGVPTVLLLAWAGNILFIISDTVLGFTIFIKEFKYSSVIVMTTYILAQFLLTWSITG